MHAFLIEENVNFLDHHETNIEAKNSYNYFMNLARDKGNFLDSLSIMVKFALEIIC